MSKYSTIEIPSGTVVYKKIILSSRIMPCSCFSGCPGITYNECGLVEMEVTKGGFICKYENEYNKKGRVRAAKVISITSMDTGEPAESGYSSYNPEFKYTVGKTVTPYSDFDEDETDTCASGIHCFLDKKDAEKYVL